MSINLITSIWPPTSDDLKTAAAVLTLFFGGGWLTNAGVKWREHRRLRRATEKLPVGDFLPSFVRSALRHYVEHEVSAIDPAGREQNRANLGPREPLFRLLDRTLYATEDKQYLLLLADSGMGKTTALLNYYAHNAKRKKHRLTIVIFSLRMQGVDEKISSVPDKSSTVLFLDALDEDPTAVANHTTRVHQLMQLARDFRAVVVSCRSQFFLSSEEITKETGIARVHHRGLGETAEYVFLKFYLCPFSDDQVTAFLRKRYPFPRLTARKRAKAALGRVPDLTVRPMLLAYIDDLTRSGHEITNLADAYRKIVEQWIERERPLVHDASALYEFSKKLAVDLYLNREARGGEQVPVPQIIGLAQEWNVPLHNWQLTGRSLLTRDAMDHFRFAHRSILEFLFVQAFMDGDSKCATVKWTDQMYIFLEDIVAGNRSKSEVVRASNVILDLSASVDRQLSMTIARMTYQDLVHALRNQLPERETFNGFVSRAEEILSQRRVESVLALALTQRELAVPRINVFAIRRSISGSGTTARKSVSAGSVASSQLSSEESEAIDEFLHGYQHRWERHNAGFYHRINVDRGGDLLLFPVGIRNSPYGILITALFPEPFDTTLGLWVRKIVEAQEGC